MSQVVVSAGQSLLDLCLQTRGSLEGLFELTILNGQGITDQLAPGRLLEVPATDAPAGDVVRYYAQRARRINTGDLPGRAPAPAELERHDWDALDFDATDWDA
jgi:hypothetical protein